MGLAQVNALIPIIMAAGYAILLVVLLIRLGWQERQARWFLGFLLVSLIWQVLLLPFPIVRVVPNLPVKALLAGTFLLGAITFYYVDIPGKRLWLSFTGPAVLAAILLDLFLPTLFFAQPSNILLQPTLGGLVSLALWLIFSGTMLLIAWRGYRNAPLPWHANRLLYWAVTLLVTFVGEALLFYTNPGLAISGQFIRFIGVLGMTYAVSSHRIFDVQTRLRRVAVFAIIVLIAAGLATLVLFLIQRFTSRLPLSQSAFITVLVIAIGFLVYRPFYRFIERILYRYLLGEEFETSKALRSYSQAIARTLDVEQLSLVIVGTISELLETNRGALMLISTTEKGYELEPIPAMGRIPTYKVAFGKDHPFVQTLATQRQPLLQYDLDFSPRFQALAAEERAWLTELAMDVYVPISTDAELTGLIALGPKGSGLTYRPNELELVQVLADQTVVALQNARLYSELGSQNERIRLLNADLRQQNTRLEIMDQVKSDFITIASHELRTPLTQVKGYADILHAMNDEDALTREQTNEIVGHINRATLQLERLISAMLDASQLDVNGMKLTFVQTKLDTVLRLAVEPVAPAMRERRLTLRLEGVREMPPIMADFKRLVQAFHNLISNGIKYTPDGGAITVSAEFITAEDKQEYLEIVVADSGVGIDPQYHDLIFEKFFRVGNPQLHSTGSTKFKGAGPGLGLPIAKGVIEAHGGRIWVESEGEDETRLPGSRFHVILPVCPPGAEEEKRQSEPADRPEWLIG
ncbi:MAG: GAF domain-containing sensor histidine kinase [Chloroflexi bacterium]|nr:GAF domain-containing sensor histidine kinase [Chloroflexota bacterium]MCI0577478.1 GAF domain-containing sensor histidine kinase [Chloroflexota bacterium]MCI0647669.1 GAF domain-containing sensor histidine kinase [Chloroflexota bacterium]MCI0730099.1 GAF domain-containing sensor histidine kinase [Chloroflexota bacterium]